MTLSKIGKMKAIHNEVVDHELEAATVVTLSKIGKMKAIHNNTENDTEMIRLL